MSWTVWNDVVWLIPDLSMSYLKTSRGTRRSSARSGVSVAPGVVDIAGTGALS